MASETLAVKLLLDSNQYQREAKKAASATGSITDAQTKTGAATGRLDSQMAGLAATAKFAVAGAATAAVTAFAKDSIRAASDLNESINAVNVTFGESAPAILAIGENAAQSFGLAKSEFNAFAVRFSNFGQTIASGTGRAVEEVIGDLTGRIADFASVMNLDVPEAAEKFQSGLAGQTEPLRAFGIDVSAAAVNAKALELGLADSTSELTEQDKVLARYQIIMRDTDKTAGDFQNTQDDLANATRTFNSQLEDFKADAGAAALPVLGDLVDTGSDLLTILEGITSILPGASDDMKEAGYAGRFVNFIFGGLPDVIGWVADRFDDAGDSADDMAVNLAATAAAAEGADRKFFPLVHNLAATAAAVEGADRHFFAYAAGLEQIGDDAGNAAPDAWDLANAIAAVNRAAKEAADPIFRAVSAVNRYETALEEAHEDNTITNEEFFELAELALDAQSALADLGSGNVNAGIKAIADAMDEPVGKVQQLLVDLGILDETTFGTTLLFDISMDPADRALLNSIRTTTGAGKINIDSADLKFTRRQHGGPVTAGEPYIVGEAGPELFIPAQSGQVLASDTAAREGGTSRTVVNIGNVYGWDDFVRKVNEAGITINRYGWADG